MMTWPEFQHRTTTVIQRVRQRVRPRVVLRVIALTMVAGTAAVTAWVALVPALLLVLASRTARAIATARTDRAALRRGIEATLAIQLIGAVWLAGFAWYTLPYTRS